MIGYSTYRLGRREGLRLLFLPVTVFDVHGSAASVRLVMVVPEIPTAHPYLRFRSDGGISPGYLSIYRSVASRRRSRDPFPCILRI